MGPWGEGVCVYETHLMGPPEETPKSEPISVSHTRTEKTQTLTSTLYFSVCLYLFFHEVDRHTILGYVFRHDCNNDLRFCLVPVMSARNKHIQLIKRPESHANFYCENIFSILTTNMEDK